MSNTSIDNLADAILQELENYSESVTEGIKKAVDTVANECNAEIKKHVTFKEPTGKYVKAFKVKKTNESKFNKGKTWYVSGGEYRLTHLLEKGHAKIGGGRTRAFPHIIFGEELAKKRMEELAKEAVENA
jgi:hypothetical protein